jgi:hypothetical protein
MPNFALSLFVKADHVAVYPRRPRFVIEIFIAFQGSVKNIKRLRITELRETGKSVWRRLGDDSEMIFRNQAFSFDSVLSSQSFNKRQTTFLPFVIDLQLGLGIKTIIQNMVVLLSLVSLFISNQIEAITAVCDFPLVGYSGFFFL